MKSTSKQNRGYRMATSTAVPATNAVVTDEEEVTASATEYGSDPVKSETIDYTRWQKIKTDKAGNAVTNDSGVVQYDIKIYSAPSDKLKKDLLDSGYELVFTQPVVSQSAGNPDGFESLITDPEERTGIFNRGYAQKRQQVLAKLFGDSDPADDSKPKWEPTEEPYNPTKEMNELTKRRNLTQDERVRRDLRDSGYDEETINIMFAAKAAAAAKKAAALQAQGQ